MNLDLLENSCCSPKSPVNFLCFIISNTKIQLYNNIVRKQKKQAIECGRVSVSEIERASEQMQVNDSVIVKDHMNEIANHSARQH